MALATTFTSFARNIIGFGSVAFDRNLLVVAIGMMSESSKEKGQTHPEGMIVHMILNTFQLTSIVFQTGFDHSQKISSTTTFQMTTTRSHFIASLVLKNLHSFIPSGRACEKFSFQESTLYCFFLSL